MEPSGQMARLSHGFLGGNIRLYGEKNDMDTIGASKFITQIIKSLQYVGECNAL